MSTENDSGAGAESGAETSTTQGFTKSEYTIYPINGHNTDVYEARVFSVVPKDKVYTSAAKRIGVVFWAVSLTERQVEAVHDTGHLIPTS